MNDSTSTQRRVGRTHLVLTGAVTALSALVLLGAMLIWAGDLPGRLATHFDLGGVADDSMATGLALPLFALVAIGLPVLLIALFAATQWWRGERARLFAGFLAGLPVGLVALFLAILHANRGAGGAEQVRLSPWLSLLALGAALVVGTVVAVLAPRGVPREPAPAVTPLELAPGERASWFGRATSSTTVMLALLASVVVVAIAALASGIWWLWLIVALLALLVAGISTFVVRIDASGLTWRSALGFPRGHLPLQDITGASVIEVSPADFGGFGIRLVPRALGLITRGGPALQVEHRGRRFVVTVEDPTTAAGLLQGLLGARHTSA
jgi:MFS family permease